MSYSPQHRDSHPVAEMGDTRGVLSSRLMAYLVDLVVIFILSGIAFVALSVLGLLTFGFAWILIPLAVGPALGIIYSGLTVGGGAHATLGMRMMGLRVVAAGGYGPGMLHAAVHALLFYLATSTGLLLLIDVIIGMGRRDGRMGHDLLVDFTVIRAR